MTGMLPDGPRRHPAPTSEARQPWPGEHALKSLLDRTCALAGIALSWPLLLGLAAVVRVKLGAPVLYGQTRPGQGERLFRLWKFRTMTDARDAKGMLLPDAERMTPTGRLLRRFSLDELPQLFNVLAGDLSLVGPRPLLVRYLPRYSPRQRLRHQVKPGITGWQQINGRNATDWTRRFELDVWYVENWSFILDIKILLATVLPVLRGKGALPGAGAEFEEFWGESGPPSTGPRALPVEADERPPDLLLQKITASRGDFEE